ncbi:hypothetical protein ABXT66_10280 [Candidatus Levibacter sp. Uisw_134_01]|uniref:hypothetical protein n=1 Tax=Candidatus Levibacter sp. Uisw_134_01 TaxID=3230999 RepID=UPI003D53DEB1
MLNQNILSLICIGFFIWLVWLIYLTFVDLDAFLISFLFVPIFGILTWRAFRSGNLILKIFSMFMFLAQAVGAPFFWVNQNKYGTSGFSSVGNFQFELNEFFLIYLWVVLIYIILIWNVKILDHIYFKNSIRPALLNQKKPIKTFKLTKNKIAYDFQLIIFVCLVMLPLNNFMAINNIGVLGMLNEPLPYRLTGITYYTRLYFAPLIIFILFSKSSRSWLIVFFILSYALIAGICSGSRSVFVISLFPVIYFSFFEKRYFMLVVILFISFFSFMLVSASRDYTWTTDTFILSDAFSKSFEIMVINDQSILGNIAGISNRFFGAQDMVLAYQYIAYDTWVSMIKYFFSGGRADTVIPDLGLDLFNINLEGTGFGVGIGTMAYFLIFAHSNIFTIPFAVLILSHMISLGNQLLYSNMANVVATKLISNNIAFGPLIMFLALFMSLFLYSSSLSFFYIIFTCLLISSSTFSLLKMINKWK